MTPQEAAARQRAREAREEALRAARLATHGYRTPREAAAAQRAAAYAVRRAAAANVAAHAAADAEQAERDARGPTSAQGDALARIARFGHPVTAPRVRRQILAAGWALFDIGKRRWVLTASGEAMVAAREDGRRRA